MRLLYTILLVVAWPTGFIAFLFLAALLDDFATRHLGKPPAWLGIVVLLCIVAFGLIVGVKAAWEQAGKWTK